MERVRDYVGGLVASNDIHPRLVANFDQVWSMKFRPSKKLWSKDKEPGSSSAPSGSKKLIAALRGEDTNVENEGKGSKDPLAEPQLH